MLNYIKNLPGRIIEEIAAQGLLAWLKGSAVGTAILGVVEWLQGRSPLEILALLILVGFGFIGLLLLLAKLKAYRGRTKPTVHDLGIRVFPNRKALDQDHSLGDRLNIARNKGVDALSVRGDNLVHRAMNTPGKLNRLLLPNPDSGSLTYYDRSVGTDIHASILSISRTAQENGISVRWCQEFFCYSMLIVDRDLESAYVHIEYVLPFSEFNERPSITFKKAEHPEIVIHFANVFDRLWDDAFPPDYQTRDESDSEPIRFDEWIPIHEAIVHVKTHLSDILGHSGTGMSEDVWLIEKALEEIQLSGKEDAVLIRGLKENKKEHRLLRSDYWTRMELDPRCIDAEDPNAPQTRESSIAPDAFTEPFPKYYHIEVKREDMLNRWNKSSRRPECL